MSFICSKKALCIIHCVIIEKARNLVLQKFSKEAFNSELFYTKAITYFSRVGDLIQSNDGSIWLFYCIIIV